MIRAITPHRTEGGMRLKNLDLTNLTLEQLFGVEHQNRAGMQEIYDRVGYLRRCVDLRGLTLANIPFEIVRTGSEAVFMSDVDKPPRGFEFLADLKRLLYLMEVSTVLSGAAYVLKERENGRLTQLFYMNPNTITPVYGDGGVVGFKRKVKLASGAMQEQTFDVADVLHAFEPSPFAEQGHGAPIGMSALDAGRVLYYLTDFLARYAQRGLIKGTLLTVDVSEGETIDDAERGRLRRAWKNLMDTFRRNADEVDVFTSQVKPITVGEGIGDLSNTQLTEDQQMTIASALGIPHSLVMSNAANYATANSDQLNMYVFTILPRAEMLADVLNKQLFDQFGFEIQFRPNRLEVMQQYELEKAQAVRNLVGGSVMSVNEGRELLGMERMNDSEYDKLADFAPPPMLSVDDRVGDLQRIAYERDLSNWKRRVKRRGHDVNFQPDHLPGTWTDVIRERLAAKMDIDSVFSGPFNVL